ncbi:hypothetical protein D3C71_2044140 [compost metagenome]
MSSSKCLGIAQALQALSAQDTFHGPANDVISGIVYGITMHLQGTPGKIGLR